MGFLSFLSSSSSSSSSDNPSAPGEVFTAIPSSPIAHSPPSLLVSAIPTSTFTQTSSRPQEAITIITPDPQSPSLPPDIPQQRKEVNPNASLYIFSIAGAAFAGGLILGVRKARRIKFEPHQIEAALKTDPKNVSSNNLTMPKVTAAPTGGSPLGAFSKPGRTSSVLSRGGSTIKQGSGKLPHERSMNDLSAISPISTPKPKSAAPSPLFPSSSGRTSPKVSSSTSAHPSLNSAVPTGTIQQISVQSPVPTLAQTAKARPTFAQFRQMYADRHKDALEDGEHEDAPPITAGAVMHAAQAFVLATVLAVSLVGVPFGAICWWLGVEEPADFTPLFRQKLSVYFPTLGTEYLRPTVPEDPAEPPSPSSLSSSSSTIASYLPDFLRSSSSAAATTDGQSLGGHTLILPSILQQGASPEGVEEQNVYTWFEEVKDAFEKDRLEEIRKRQEEDREWKAWEEEMKMKNQGISQRV
ncbi:hypothetical protein [Phaffia rhodozyma]|uniref:Transmembrane protein n=1 Tax=Phaffia rhodozyma TaxID=264483 RepID=A0A0F7SLC6_PHARH|nr:hypothetical protein [Phaffia rhodozyma]